MPRDWCETFKIWAKPPSETEEAKGSNAARMIREALREYPPLKARNFDVYATGSYRNNTNVRLGSDIDVAVALRDVFYDEYPIDGTLSRDVLGFTSASYGLTEFRKDVGNALVVRFGPSGVTQGNKTFNVHENSYRLDADVTTFCEHRRYTGRRHSDGGWEFHSGVETRPLDDPRTRIINWHDQHYSEGVARNNATRRRFKRLTRIIKRLRNEMRDSGSPEAKQVAGTTSSFLIECLVFNAADNCFNLEEGSYFQDAGEVIRQLWLATKSDDDCERFVEVSGLKWLFRPTQPWNRAHAHEFLLRAWQHIGFN